VSDVVAHRPRLNHVAIPVPSAQLDDRARAEILDFYGAVLGWTEGDNTGEQGNPLILYTGEFGEFLYLAPTDDADAGGAAVDHVGMQVATREELEEIVARARERQASDDRVRVSEIGARTTHGPSGDYLLSSAYIRFALPFSVELQNIARAP
jgi:catechol 2,3-dioxygenase-like lactoylglutathione lyase family enzyme